MNKKISYAELAFDAMCRASKHAQKKAAENNLKLPVWEDGKIIFADPKEMLKKNNC